MIDGFDRRSHWFGSVSSLPFADGDYLMAVAKPGQFRLWHPKSSKAIRAKSNKLYLKLVLKALLDLTY